MNKKKLSYLVCVNGEKYSETALHFASIMAQKNSASIILLHVIEPVDYQSVGSIAEKMRKEKFDEADKLLISLAGKIKKWVDITPIYMTKEGMIEEQIIAVIGEDKSINMVVLGAPPETSAKSKVLPTLVSSIGRKFHIPMLIVPGDITNKQIEHFA